MTDRHEEGDMDDAAIAELLRLDARPGPAVRVPSKRAAAMVEAALDAWEADPRADAPGPRQEPAPVRSPARRGRARWALLAAAAVFVLLAVAAAYWVGRERGLSLGERAEPRRVAAGGPAVAERPPEAAATNVAGPPSEGEPTPPARGELPGAPEPTPGPAPAPEPATQGPIAPVQPRAHPRSAAASTGADEPAQSPDDLLREANRLRGAHRWREAERTYARVVREHPRTMSAHVARVAQAGLRLEHLGDPAGALRLYRGALGGGRGGALALEARQGIAESYRRLGNTAEEARALRQLVQAHPGTAAARRASRRLEALGAR